MSVQTDGIISGINQSGFFVQLDEVLVDGYIAIDSIHQRYEKKLFGKLNFHECVSRYIKSIDNERLAVVVPSLSFLMSRLSSHPFMYFPPIAARAFGVCL